MPFSFRKRNTTIEKFCAEFYDAHLLGSLAREDTVAWHYLESCRCQLHTVATGLSTTESSTFQDEATALWLEVFAFAWLDQFQRGKPVIPQSQFTQRYLEARSLGHLWSAMAAYNNAVSRVEIPDNKRTSIDPARLSGERARREELIAKWVQKNGYDADSVIRVANRLRAEMKRDSAAVAALASTFLDRISPAQAAGSAATQALLTTGLDARSCLFSAILRMYRDDLGKLRDISLPEAMSVRWW